MDRSTDASSFPFVLSIFPLSCSICRSICHFINLVVCQFAFFIAIIIHYSHHCMAGTASASAVAGQQPGTRAPLIDARRRPNRTNQLVPQNEWLICEPLVPFMPAHTSSLTRAAGSMPPPPLTTRSNHPALSTPYENSNWSLLGCTSSLSRCAAFDHCVSPDRIASRSRKSASRESRENCS